MEGSERRGSIGRAFEKLRTAMRRRGSSSKEVPTLATSSTTQAPLDTITDGAVSTTSGPSASVEPTSTIDTHEARLSTLSNGPPLLADSGTAIEADDNDEPLLPMFSSRIGISEDKAQRLFERYGLAYEPRKGTKEQEPPSKVRRVEKAVRLRIHWKCHECQSHFARDRICVSCGHRRCTECTRTPAKRVKEIMDSTKQQKEQEEQQQAVPSAVAQETELSKTQDKSATAAGLNIAPTQPLEKDDNANEDRSTGERFKMAMQTRPRTGQDLILRPKTQIIRRSCHKCETPFMSASRTECENCQHTRCTLCPRYPNKPEKWPMGSPGDEQAPEEEVRMVRAVQRVYKKPRQRVRYSCEQCQTVFVDADRCRQCGHPRCDGCARNPPKRATATYDPAIAQAVADRLAGYRMPAQNLGITAAG